jgi:hypothetical protein
MMDEYTDEKAGKISRAKQLGGVSGRTKRRPVPASFSAGKAGALRSGGRANFHK